MTVVGTVVDPDYSHSTHHGHHWYYPQSASWSTAGRPQRKPNRPSRFFRVSSLSSLLWLFPGALSLFFFLSHCWQQWDSSSKMTVKSSVLVFLKLVVLLIANINARKWISWNAISRYEIRSEISRASKVDSGNFAPCVFSKVGETRERSTETNGKTNGKTLWED